MKMSVCQYCANCKGKNTIYQWLFIDQLNWKNGFVVCRYWLTKYPRDSKCKTMEDEEPPEECLYYLEHIVLEQKIE